jgi:hypothetical protein
MNCKLAERMSNPSSDSISAPIHAESTAQPIREPPQLSNKKLQKGAIGSEFVIRQLSIVIFLGKIEGAVI